MKKILLLSLIFVLLFSSMGAFAKIENERGYTFADDTARVITNITVSGDIAELSAYVRGGIYGFLGISVEYAYNSDMLTLIKKDGTVAEKGSAVEDVIEKGKSKLKIGTDWIESLALRENGNSISTVNYFIASTKEFASYKNGECENLFSIRFKINDADIKNIENYISYADRTVISCGDINIYYNLKENSGKAFDGKNMFEIKRDFVAESIAITDDSYTEKEVVYIAKGQEKQLYIKTDFPTENKWKTESNIISVNDGKITAKSVGKATLSVTDTFGNEDVIEVVVKEKAIVPEKIDIVYPETVLAGDFIRPEFSFPTEDATETDIKWSVSGEKAVLLTSDPVIWALSVGTFKLNAMSAVDSKIFASAEITVLPAPNSSEKIESGVFLVPEKIYAKQTGATTIDISPKMFNVAGAPISKETVEKYYYIEYENVPTADGITFENGVLKIQPYVKTIKDIEITAAIKYRADNKTLFTLKSNRFSIVNASLTDVKITGTDVIKTDFKNGVYEVSASKPYRIVPVSNGNVYVMSIKNNDVTDVYFFSSDKPGVYGYNFDYLIKHIKIKEIK